MSRPDPINALRRVSDAVDSSDLLTPLSHISQAARPSDALDFVPILMSSYGEFHAAAKHFGSTERKVCDLLNLGSLFDENLWGGLLGTPELSSTQLGALHELHGRVHFATNYIPDLASLSEDTHASYSLVPVDQTVLALGLRPIESSKGVDTSQLGLALHGLEMLYVASCTIAGVQTSHLIVQNWRGQPMPMISVMIDKDARVTMDRVLGGLTKLLGDRAGARSGHALTDILLDADIFRQLDAEVASGALDQATFDEAGGMLIDGCLELLAAGVIPPGLTPSLHATLDDVAVQAEHELREHAQSIEEHYEEDVEPDEREAEQVRLVGHEDREGHGAYDVDEEEYVGAEVVPLVPVDERDYDEHDEEDLQIVVEMDGEMVDYDEDRHEDDEHIVDEADDPEQDPADPAAEPVDMIEPEIVTNKAFKRALKDLRKSGRR